MVLGCEIFVDVFRVGGPSSFVVVPEGCVGIVFVRDVVGVLSVDLLMVRGDSDGIEGVGMGIPKGFTMRRLSEPERIIVEIWLNL